MSLTYRPCPYGKGPCRRCEWFNYEDDGFHFCALEVEEAYAKKTQRANEEEEDEEEE